MTATVSGPTGPSLVDPPPAHRPGPEAVTDLVEALTRHVRAVHVLKAQVARAQTEAERAMHTVLFVLDDAGPQRVSALAERLVTDPSTTSRQTAELVRRDLLERLPDPDDRRASLLALTDAGRELLVTMRAKRTALLGQAVADWSDAEVHDFTRSLDRFTAGIERTRCGVTGTTPAAPRTPDPTCNARENA